VPVLSPGVVFLVRQHLTEAALGTDADLGGVNFSLLVVGDLGAHR
jgi:hypothetical protein